MRNGTDGLKCGTERMGLKCGTERMGLKCGTERNGYGVKMRNGTNMRLKLNLKPISVPFRIIAYLARFDLFVSRSNIT